jgi:hypothetical protein
MRTALIFTASLVLSVRPALGQSPQPDRATLRFLERLRQPDGGYAPNAQAGAMSSLRATAAAVRAYRHFGGTPAEDFTGRFVMRCHDATTGGFADAPGQPVAVMTTAVGIMAAVDLRVDPSKYRDAATRYLSEHAKSIEETRLAAAAFEALQIRPPITDRWLRHAEELRNPDGTFGSGRDTARMTGGTTALIVRLGAAIEHRDAVLKAMRDGQRSDGGFGSADRDSSDLESTYRVMRAFMMMKERPADLPQLRAFLGKCRAASGGYGVVPGDAPSAAGTYYASAVLSWIDPPKRR